MRKSRSAEVPELNIQLILQTLLRRYKLVLLTTVLCGLVVLLLLAFAFPDHYECAAYFGLETPIFKAGRAPSTDEWHRFEAAARDCDQVLRSSEAVEGMMAYTDPGTTRDQLLEMLRVEPVLDTALIRVVVRGENAKEVARLAEKIGRMLPQLSANTQIYRKSYDEEAINPFTANLLRDTVNATIFGFVLGVSLVVLWMMKERKRSYQGRFL